MITFDLETKNDEAASPASTPKLSLHKLPSKQREPLVMFTPPVTTSAASIPFQWEEVPGKLRPDFRTNSSPAAAAAVKDKNSVARCLDLPPRLLNNKNTSTSTHNVIHHPPDKQLLLATDDSSPTTVLDGPYPHGAGGPSFSRSSTFYSPKTKGSFRSLEDEIFRDVKYQQQRRDATDEVIGKRNVINRMERFASRKWGSYKDNKTTAHDGRFSSTTGDYHSFRFASCASTSRTTRVGSSSSGAKLPRLIKRRSSFLSFSHASSNLIGGIYGSFKQVLPWRRRQGQKKDYTVG